MGVRCAGFYVTSLSFNKEVTKKVNPDEPLGASLSVPRCKAKDKKNIRVYTASHASLPPRAAGGKSKNVFVKKLVTPGCVADGKSLCFCSSRVFSRWHFYLKRQRKS